MPKETILGIIITFNPPIEFLSNLDALCKQVDRVLIVDNTSNADFSTYLTQELNNRDSIVEVIFNQLNLGVATALNQAFNWGIINGYDYAVVFDQDSTPDSNMIQELLLVYKNYRNNKEKIAIVSPNIIDAQSNTPTRFLRKKNKFSFERVQCKQDFIDDVSLIITSGSLNDLSAYKEIGDFRDDFFIDYVDTEYCLRAKKFGFKILVACKANLLHRLGNQKLKRIGIFKVRPTFHSPLRWYYINRNRIIMHSLYAFRYPYWAIYDFMSGCYLMMKMLLFEDQKSRKIFAFFLGVVDGIFGRMGQITAYREAQVSGRK